MWFCSACVNQLSHRGPLGGTEHQAHCAWLRRTRAHAHAKTPGPGLRPKPSERAGADAAHLESNLYLELHAHVASLLPAAWAARYRPGAKLGRTAAEVLVAAHPAATAATNLGGSKAPRLTVKTAATCLCAIDDWDAGMVEMADRMFPAATVAAEGARSRPTVHGLIIEPLTHLFSFSVPNHEALDAIAAVGPIVEVGCGTGYWASLLRLRGVDVLAFDLHPPTTAASDNGFHSAAWTEVLRGGPEVLSQDGSASDPGRALMLSWPSNDPADCWDARCLAAYRGDTVVYVGSWNVGSLAVPGFAGTCSSPAFQRALAAGFELAATVRIPAWPASADLVTVWKRRRGNGRVDCGVVLPL